MTAEPPISLLDFRPAEGADVPFEIGRLETTHRLHQNTRPHRHRFHEIIWFVEGAGAYAADFEEHTIRPHTVFLVSPGQVHAVRVDRPLSGYMLLFTTDLLAPDGITPDGAAGLPFFRPGAANPVLTLTGEDAGRLRAVAEDLLAEFAAPDTWRRDMLRARLQVMLLALGRVARRPGAPVAPPASPVARFQGPAATVLTSDGHERFGYAVRERWGTPVWGPRPGEAQRDEEYDGVPDHLCSEGDPLPGGLRAVRLAGMWRGDHALLLRAPATPAGPDGTRVLFSGDVLNGQVEPDLSHEEHFRREPGLYFGARPGYVARHAHPAALKASLQRLLGEDFDLIAGAHGRPFRDHPREALARLIETI